MQTQVSSTHIFAVSHIDRLDTVVRPQHSPDCSDAYAIGELDRFDGKPCEPLAYYSDLACIESYIIGYRAARKAETQPADGALQKLIDYGAEAADYEDYLADVEFNRLGC